MGDLLPPQVPQGLGREEKEDERCEPDRVQPQGIPLARHPADVFKHRIFSIKDCRTDCVCYDLVAQSVINGSECKE